MGFIPQTRDSIPISDLIIIFPEPHDIKRQKGFCCSSVDYTILAIEIILRKWGTSFEN
jgi:hypothetical protein